MGGRAGKRGCKLRVQVGRRTDSITTDDRDDQSITSIMDSHVMVLEDTALRMDTDIDVSFLTAKADKKAITARDIEKSTTTRNRTRSIT
jgi:ABC-type molybdate transport system ATPase subunit